jgi:hypothetical protein
MQRILTKVIVVATIAVAPAVGISHAINAASPASVHGVKPAAGSSCPAMPKRAPRGYRIAVKDHFSGSSLSSRTWFRWSGEPGGDPYGWWKTGRHITTGRMLDLHGKWVTSGGNPTWTNGGEITGGVGTRHAQTYGEYQWCMRSVNMLGTSTIVLLWPKSGHWPPEIDWYESDGDPTWYTMTVHYGTPQANYAVQKTVTGRDATTWHVFTAMWKHDFIQLREDGAVVSTIISSHVPSEPMRLDFQTQAIGPNAAVGDTDVGWVVEYTKTT